MNSSQSGIAGRIAFGKAWAVMSDDHASASTPRSDNGSVGSSTPIVRFFNNLRSQSMSHPLNDAEPAPPPAGHQAAIDQYVRSLQTVAEPLRKLIGHARVDLLESAFELREQ